MGDVNLEIKLSNLDERVIKIEETGGGSGGDGYITSVSNDFNVVNKKLSLSNDVTTKLSKVDNKIDKPTSATEGQVLTYRNNEWVADDSQGGGQFVIIAKGKKYEGQTVTATKGTKSKSAVITSGVARIPVDEGGIWTLTLSSGKTRNTPNMTYYGEYEVTFATNGATVTPTDDVQTWLHCADIWDKTDITTIGGVLTDTTTLNTLISDNNASDYLARSTTWASDVCNNESAMTYIGLNDYCANKLLDNSTWLNAIGNSAYFEKVLNKFVPPLTSNTGSDGGEASGDFDNPAYYTFVDASDRLQGTNKISIPKYVAYDFKKPVIVRLIKIKSWGKRTTYKPWNMTLIGDNGAENEICKLVGNNNILEQKFNITNNISYNKYKLVVNNAYNGSSTTDKSNTFCNLDYVNFYGREGV